MEDRKLTENGQFAILAYRNCDFRAKKKKEVKSLGFIGTSRYKSLQFSEVWACQCLPLLKRVVS
jgi:hypothetical protein